MWRASSCAMVERFWGSPLLVSRCLQERRGDGADPPPVRDPTISWPQVCFNVARMRGMGPTAVPEVMVPKVLQRSPHARDGAKISRRIMTALGPLQRSPHARDGARTRLRTAL